ncbi:MAG: imidazole glycerol phosphate synthase subunit HisH [Clostridia bacterium]
MIAIIDYGVGNLFSLSSSLTHLGIENIITNKKEDLENASHIILPGVGAFGDAIAKLHATGLVEPLTNEINGGKPMLGICLGMQLLFETSDEYGTHTGLGYIKGHVKSLDFDIKSNNINLKVPHMGWNCLEIQKPENPLMKYTKQGDYVYFVHSFYAKNCENSLVASANYGVKVPGTVANKNVYGCQFHPEKSGSVGLKILKAFSEI